MGNLPTRRAFLGAGAAGATLAPAAAPPNVIILLTDDQGYGDLSCHGNPVLKTPNIDRIHGESIRFTDFHSAPMCTPTRSQLLTGMDALRNRATSVTAGRAVIQRGIPTMGDVFANSGYATGIFGKWHVGDAYPYRPMDRGFQEAKYHLGWGLSSAPEFDNDYFDGRYRDKGVTKRFRGYCTDFWFNEAMAWMDERKRRNERFFCYLPTNAPHGPLWVAAKYAALYDKPGLPANFFGMIANIDENVGKLEQFLRDSGLRDNTIFIFMTDNGGTAGVRFYNAGMRANKTQLYDGGHRVPCFVRWTAGNLRGAGDVASPAQMQDLLPTLIDLCGLKKPVDADFDGTSLAKVLREPKTELPDRMLVVQYGQQLDKWDSCVIWGKWRLVKGTELYDIRADPGQKSDVATQHGDIQRKMRAHYEKWWSRVEPTLRDFQPLSIGAPQENPVTLTSSDWQEVYCDNVNSILNGLGGPRGGPWNIFVEEDGTYEIALRRWPAEAKLPLSAPRAEQKMTAGVLPAGKALPVAQTQMAIAGQSLSVKNQPDDMASVFRVRLKKGARTQLQGWFQDASGNDLAGAYYAGIRRT